MWYYGLVQIVIEYWYTDDVLHITTGHSLDFKARWLPCSLIEEAEGYDAKQFVIPDSCCSALEGMENYTKLGKLGEGTYGVVYKVGKKIVPIYLLTLFRRRTKRQSRMWHWSGFIWKRKVKGCPPQQSGDLIILWESKPAFAYDIQGDSCSERAQPPSSGETSGRGCCGEEIVSCVWAFGQGAIHSMCYLLLLWIYYAWVNSINYIKASPSFQKDLKKLLDDNNREMKAQGSSGGGLPQDLVRFRSELL